MLTDVPEELSAFIARAMNSDDGSELLKRLSVQQTAWCDIQEDSRLQIMLTWMLVPLS
jgi:hypothetical protein